MTAFNHRWRATTIRVRLGLVLAAALAPVLVLSTAQSALTFRRELHMQRAALVGAAQRSAATVNARMAAAEVLLQTLAPESIGFQCAPRLRDVMARVPGYANLIRFDTIGRVACAAATAPADEGRRRQPWFQALAAGAPRVVTSDTGGVAYAREPALLAAVRAQDDQGRFAGALTAVITLASLRPTQLDHSLPAQSDVAITDADGQYLSSTSLMAFPEGLKTRLGGRAHTEATYWFGTDRAGTPRVFTSAPLAGDHYMVLSAPSQGLASWVWLNPISALALPILAFTLALAAVWVVADQGMVRWIAYMRRIASIYARGRYSVHPVRAQAAAPEIRELAEALDIMAGALVARDQALKSMLAQKDILMREIHHRVRNNLQVISSLLSLQQRAMTDPAARTAMSDTRQRISALALIYRALYQGEDLRRVELGSFLEELIAQLVLSDSGAARGIRTGLALEPLAIDPDRLAPLALFAVEAISNAKKHGLDGDGAHIQVTLTTHDGQARLDISDSGKGGDGPDGQGVGRTLMKGFARQLEGEATFFPNPTGGSTTRLTFPTHKGFLAEPEAVTP